MERVIVENILSKENNCIFNLRENLYIWLFLMTFFHGTYSYAIDLTRCLLCLTGISTLGVQFGKADK